uniref:Cilia- and flagella-associated protein 44 n=1 Tax=Helobdella robusta TaxID=6412 RepID=T1G027_HELRO
MFSFHSRHSFGYDCLKRSNLHCIEEHVVAFTAGNYVVLLNVVTKEQKFIRSTSRGGVEALAVHPTRKYLSVAEKGVAPNIVVYELQPQLVLHRLLKNGTELVYSNVDFSPDGLLLASLGGDPDYLLTVWDWEKEIILLRSKAYSQDIYKVVFSMELPGQLTTAGTGHIKFWKMAKTFTGLKLQGYLGKFQKTEISDIEGFVEFPDSKVLSSCEWGNLLLWDGGLIKVEICGKNKMPCHRGSIQQIILMNGVVITVGLDGFIRGWDFGQLDNSDISGESEAVEVEPIYELHIPGAHLKCISKLTIDKKVIDNVDDGAGAMWRINLSMSDPTHSLQPPTESLPSPATSLLSSSTPECLFRSHSGPISSICASPLLSFIASIGIDCTVRVYDYNSCSMVACHKFSSPGMMILWLPTEVDAWGNTIVAGFEDGVVRVLQLTLKSDISNNKNNDIKRDSSTHDSNLPMDLLLVQVLKPHKHRVSTMDVLPGSQLLATGSYDGTVFFLKINRMSADDSVSGASVECSTNNKDVNILEPLGFITTPSRVTYAKWSSNQVRRESLLVCCAGGEVMEVESPSHLDINNKHTYMLDKLKLRRHSFKSIKSYIEVRIREKELEGMKKNALKRESSIESEPWKATTSNKPSPVMWGLPVVCVGTNSVWISLADYDAGFLYQVEFDDEQFTSIDGVKNENISSEDISSDEVKNEKSNDASEQYLILGFNNGWLMFYDKQNFGPLSNTNSSYWALNIHDGNYGRVTGVSMSYDGKYLFTAGTDGNLFMFKINLEMYLDEDVDAAKRTNANSLQAQVTTEDIKDSKAFSIEEACKKLEYDEMIRSSELKKFNVRKRIKKLTDEFVELWQANNMLPKFLKLHEKVSLQLTISELVKF